MSDKKDFTEFFTSQSIILKRYSVKKFDNWRGFGEACRDDNQKADYLYYFRNN